MTGCFSDGAEARGAFQNRSQRAEAAWSGGRASILSILDALGQGISVSDRDWRIEYANPGYAEMLGCAPGELVGRSCHSLTHPEDQVLIERAVAARREGRTTSYEVRQRAGDDGDWVSVLVSGTPRFIDGNFAGSFAVITDLRPIQGRHALLTEIAEGVSGLVGEAFFESLVKHLARVGDADVAMVAERIAPDRVRTRALWIDGRIVDPLEYSLSGTPCEDVLQRGVCLHEKEVAEQYPEDVFLREHGIQAYCGISLGSHDGESTGLVALLKRTPFDDAPGIPAALKIFAARAGAELDRRRSEEELLQARKLESLGRLAGGIAHDFNNVLTAILGALDLLGDRREVGGDEFELIRSAAQRATCLTDQLLTFSKSTDRASEVVDLNVLLRESELLLRTVFGDDTRLSMELDSKPCGVAIVAGQFQQALLNMALNARDAMPEGGEFSIATRCLGSEGVELRVCDTGTGMSPEVRTRAFDPFFSTKETGTGLGLASVHGIISASGGTIKIKDQPGGGTCLLIRLPSASFEAPSESHPVPCKSEQRPLQLLVVEDEETVRRLLERVLEREGHHVRSARDGVHALALVRDESFVPDLVITDVSMPGMSGVELAGKLRRHLPDVPFLFLSGYLEDGTPLDGVYLRKPFLPRELLEQVENALRSNMQVADDIAHDPR